MMAQDIGHKVKCTVCIFILMKLSFFFDSITHLIFIAKIQFDFPNAGAVKLNMERLMVNLGGGNKSKWKF